MILLNPLVQWFSALSWSTPCTFCMSPSSITPHSAHWWTKPGRCPPQSSGSKLCTSSCKNDSNCPKNEKCCRNGCGSYCTAPYRVKPGQCPIPEMIPMSAESCFHDGQCPATQKCCPTTSGRTCSEP
uniref:WAP domain-containing protein n=1 Tax=Cyprinus carpio TaxID=7962 RepID=A0A8C1Y952_CYPCA